MRIGFGKMMLASAVVVAALIGYLTIKQPAPPATSPTAPAATGPTTLLLYCSAGLQPPVFEIIKDYEGPHNVKFETQFRGSGSLLSEIMVSGGDLFLVADRLYLDDSSQKKVALEIVPIAYQYPVIVVQKGNPKHIAGLADLLKPDVRLALADPKRAAIGKALSELLAKDERWDALWKKAVIQRQTVNEVGNDVKIGAADAGIVWNATAIQYPDLVVLHVPEFDKSKHEISVGLLVASKNPQKAQEFIDYLSSPEGGLRAFARHGYEVVGPKPAAAH